MTGDDPGGYAQLWLSEMGAYVPEQHDGLALAPREKAFGLGLPVHERARRHGARLQDEPTAARVHRLVSDRAARRA